MLARLAVKLRPAERGDVGWDVFLLDYAIDSPLHVGSPRTSEDLPRTSHWFPGGLPGSGKVEDDGFQNRVVESAQIFLDANLGVQSNSGLPNSTKS